MKKHILFLISIVLLSMMTACGEKEATVRYISYNIRNSRADDGDNAWDLRKSATKQMLENEEIQDTDNEWLKGNAVGKSVVYHIVWNNIHDRFFYACKKTGRMKEFNELKKERL
mgnify:CR=1 FL=1